MSNYDQTRLPMHQREFAGAAAAKFDGAMPTRQRLNQLAHVTLVGDGCVAP